MSRSTTLSAIRFALAAATLTVALAACGPPPYRMDAPPAFKRFQTTDDFRYVTADGVMLEARQVDNYPEAELSFWVEAMKRHLGDRGYVLSRERSFRTGAGLDGCTLDFVLPYGAEDWVMSETLYVRGETIYVVEAAGPYDRFEAVRGELASALETFDPGED